MPRIKWRKSYCAGCGKDVPYVGEGVIVPVPEEFASKHDPRDYNKPWCDKCYEKLINGEILK